MKINHLMFAALGAAVFSCNSLEKNNESTTESGMTYIKHVSSEGKKTDSLDICSFHYEIYNAADSLLNSSFEMGAPVQVQLGRTPGLGAIEEALFLMGESDSMTIKVVASKIFPQRTPPDIAATDMLKVVLKLDKVQNEDDFMAEMQKAQQQLMEDEDRMIAEFVAQKGEKATKTESGLYYIITKAGKGKTPQVGNEVTVHYKGMLMDGTKFDASYDRNEPFKFALGQGRVIAGWDEGIGLLTKGTKATFYIPSHLAYGSRGAGGVIGPDETLIFEVELLDFK